MPIKEDREYRSFSSFVIEKRDEDGIERRIVDGYASTFDEYELRNAGNQIWTERLDPHAFDEADMSDVVFLKDHQGTVFARTKNNTIALITDEHGLHAEADLSKTQSARQMYEEIEAGMYTQMSFAFRVSKQHFEREERDGVSVIHRIIDKVSKVFDVSAVSFPANPTTEIGVATRSAFDGAIEEFEAERLRVEAEQREIAKKKLELKLKLTEDLKHDK